MQPIHPVDNNFGTYHHQDLLTTGAHAKFSPLLPYIYTAIFSYFRERKIDLVYIFFLMDRTAVKEVQLSGEIMREERAKQTCCLFKKNYHQRKK